MPATDGVKPTFGVYAPFPDTVAVPIVVPPLEHVDGADACWKYVNVIVPPAFDPELLASVPVIAEAATTVPAVPEAGAATVSVGEALATLISCAEPGGQALAALLLLPSPG